MIDSPPGSVRGRLTGYSLQRRSGVLFTAVKTGYCTRDGDGDGGDDNNSNTKDTQTATDHRVLTRLFA